MLLFHSLKLLVETNSFKIRYEFINQIPGICKVNVVVAFKMTII